MYAGILLDFKKKYNKEKYIIDQLNDIFTQYFVEKMTFYRDEQITLSQIQINYMLFVGYLLSL